MSDSQSEQVTGQGLAQNDSAKSVFINCPFDADFEPLFQAIIFAIVCSDFHPRSALESGTVAEPRMERITRAIFSSRYSIHDLSRCKGEGDERLARFNMPLELGIAMACRYFTRGTAEQHDWLLLVPEGHVYVKVVSDLAGFDPKQYDGKTATIIQSVMSWLVTRREMTLPTILPTPKNVHEALPLFQAEIAQLKQHWGAELPWPYLLEAAKKHAPTQQQQP
jgi:hypothetical protein